MQLSTSTLPIAGRTLEMVLGCYLIQTSDGKNILIDSGLPADYMPPPGMPPAEYGKNVLEHLADLSLRPDDIDILICTHFDVDYVGYHDAFPKRNSSSSANITNWRGADMCALLPRVLDFDHPALRYWLIDRDTELLPGLSLLETSGHTPGHQSVLVRLPQMGPVLLAIDAVMISAFLPLIVRPGR